MRGACWYLSSLHSQLQQKLPHSRSVRQLGESVETILASEAVQTSLEPGRSAQEWVAEYLVAAQRAGEGTGEHRQDGVAKMNERPKG